MIPFENDYDNFVPAKSTQTDFQILPNNRKFSRKTSYSPRISIIGETIKPPSLKTRTQNIGCNWIPIKTCDELPKLDWEPSISSIERKIFENEYRVRRKSLPNLPKRLVNTSKIKLGYTPDPIITKITPPSCSVEKIPPKQKSVSPSNEDLLKLSYGTNKKFVYPKPTVKGIDQPWNYLIQRKWPEEVVTSIYFKTLARSIRELPYGQREPYYGQWPYIPALSKKKLRTSSSKKLNVTDEEVYTNLSITESLPHTKKSLHERLTNLPKQTKKEFHPVIETLSENEVAIPSVFEGNFKKDIIKQSVHISATLQEPHWTYKLSDLENYSLKRTHLLDHHVYHKVGFYYSDFDKSQDLFRDIRTEKYKNGGKLIEVTGIGEGIIFYPNGKKAITCSNGLVNDDLPGRRYTIYNENGYVLGVFDSLGNGTAFNEHGEMILNYSQNFGNYLKLKWRWHNIPIANQKIVVRTDSIDLSKREYPLVPATNKLAFLPNGKINYGSYTKLTPFKVQLNRFIHLQVVRQKLIKLHFNQIITLDLGIHLDPNQMLKIEEICRPTVACTIDSFIGTSSSLLNISKRIKEWPGPSQCDEAIPVENKKLYGRDFIIDNLQTGKTIKRKEGQLANNQGFEEDLKIVLSMPSSGKVQKPKIENYILEGGLPVISNLYQLVKNKIQFNTLMERLKQKEKFNSILHVT